ncbi:DUF1232 domain-containing protein [Candidatus Pacearchaeota archaeon]|nr:DUF1232 domain-containing protein [Candidatus Pacearchaeota archaeon]
MKDYIDFESRFKDLIERHKDDEYYNAVKDYPKIFSVIIGIASDKNSDGVVKMLMNSAIAYFVLVEDVVSEKEGGIKGYLDDFFVCISALRELLEHDKKLGKFLISKHWNLEERYENYIAQKYYELTQRINSNLISDIYSYSGLKFISERILAENNPRTYSTKKIRELERKIYYLFFLFLNRPLTGKKEEKRKFEKDFFGTGEFMEFAKKIELLSKTDDEFNMAHDNIEDMFDVDKRLKKIRAERLLK